jgi:hypothetical protein
MSKRTILKQYRIWAIINGIKDKIIVEAFSGREAKDKLKMDFTEARIISIWKV